MLQYSFKYFINRHFKALPGTPRIAVPNQFQKYIRVQKFCIIITADHIKWTTRQIHISRSFGNKFFRQAVKKCEPGLIILWQDLHDISGFQQDKSLRPALCSVRFQYISPPSFINLRRKSSSTNIWHETEANVPSVPIFFEIFFILSQITIILIIINADRLCILLMRTYLRLYSSNRFRLILFAISHIITL